MKDIGYPLRVSVNVTTATKQRERSPQNGMLNAKLPNGSYFTPHLFS